MLAAKPATMPVGPAIHRHAGYIPIERLGLIAVAKKCGAPPSRPDEWARAGRIRTVSHSGLRVYQNATAPPYAEQWAFADAGLFCLHRSIDADFARHLAAGPDPVCTGSGLVPSVRFELTLDGF